MWKLRHLSKDALSLRHSLKSLVICIHNIKELKMLTLSFLCCVCPNSPIDNVHWKSYHSTTDGCSQTGQWTCRHLSWLYHQRVQLVGRMSYVLLKLGTMMVPECMCLIWRYGVMYHCVSLCVTIMCHSVLQSVYVTMYVTVRVTMCVIVCITVYHCMWVSVIVCVTVCITEYHM